MKKSAKVTLLLLLAASGAALAFAGAQPEALRTVSEVVEEGDSAVGSRVEVKATVKPGSFNDSASPVTFTVTDDVHDLRVVYVKAFPAEHQDPGGKTVVIKGVLERGPDGGMVLMGDGVVMGCPSKYEEETPAA